MISVLIPSRGRPEALSRSVDSLLNAVSNPADIEIIARIDIEDESLEQYVDKRVTFIRGPEYSGYCSMQRFWNELAAVAKGDWFMCFNDDALMETQGWDDVVRSYDPTTMTCLIPEDNSTENQWPAFPIIPRQMYDKLGHITLFPGLDTWVKYVWEAAKLPTARIPIVINHIRDSMNDETMEDSAVASKFLSLDFDFHRRDYWRSLIEADARNLCESE